MKLKILYERRAILLEMEKPEHGSEDTFRRCLVVGDLHIGFEERFRGAGIRIQPNVESMQAELEAIIDETKPTDLVLNGDVKSGIDRILESEWENIPKFFIRLLKKARVHVVPGNHDGGLINLMPKGVDLLDINGILISDTLVMHGHTKPLIKFKDCKRIVVGHMHPVFQKRGNPLSGHPVWVFLRVPKKSIFEDLLEEDVSTVEVILMPSFNLELASTGYASETRSERRVSPLARYLREAKDALVVTLHGEIVGDNSVLDRII